MLNDANLPQYLTRDVAAKMLGLSPKTLANLACAGDGPKFHRPSGGKALYPLADLVAWVEG